MANIYFPLWLAIFLTIFAAALWGSWEIIIKYTKDYPVQGIVFFLYTFSFILIWIATVLLKPVLMPDIGIFSFIGEHMNVSVRILLAGMLMTASMYTNLTIMKAIGLLLTTAISGAVGCVLGLVITVSQEGLPNIPNALTKLIICALIFIVAGLVSNLASSMRDKDLKKDKKKQTVTATLFALMIAHSLLGTGWSIGTSAGTANSFPPVVTCALMVTGSFIGSIILCAIPFTVKHQWKEVLCIGRDKKPILLCIIAALCHYGGNLISIYSMPEISATLSYLFGRSSSMWSVMWGLYFREFAGAKKRTFLVLALGMLLYFFGLFYLGYIKYGH
ncbi:MAG: hypothetical protein IKE18_09285 [Oscillospiraceae bacterium]|nr:hypothetical protein [Oscillospiraceae bacterium]